MQSDFHSQRVYAYITIYRLYRAAYKIVVSECKSHLGAHYEAYICACAFTKNLYDLANFHYNKKDILIVSQSSQNLILFRASNHSPDPGSKYMTLASPLTHTKQLQLESISFSQNVAVHYNYAWYIYYGGHHRLQHQVYIRQWQTRVH